jgi:NitT/TauT family transport system ATP-binding protein
MTVTSPAPPSGDPAVPTTLLEFSDVSMRFPDGTHALTGVDLTVRKGEFVSVVGPSGCGKSTLLRIASGLESVTGGRVAVGVAARRIGYVFQDATLLPWRTVRRNVELLAELHRMPKPDRAAKTAEAIELVGLTGFEEHLPRQLSGGM